MANNNTSNTGRSIYLDTTAAQTALTKLTEKSELLTRQIQAGEKAGKSMGTEIAKLSEIKGKITEVQNVLDKGLSPSLREQEKLVKKLRLELRGMSSDADGFNQKRKAYIAATGDLENLRGKVGAVSKANNLLGGSFLSFTKGAIGIAAATVGIQGLFSVLEGAVTEAQDAEESMSRLKNTLANVGREDALERLVTKSTELAQSFKFLDNDDINGVFQKLITYGKLTERQIGELTDVIINFSQKNKISLEESSSVIIKALEGSGKALKEYGISIKDGGDVTERFGIIMNDLKPKVDGAAAAFGETFKGQLAIARQEIKDTQEEIGNGLIPILAAMLRSVQMAFKGVAPLFETVKDFFALQSLSGALAVNKAKAIKEGREVADANQINNMIKSYERDAKGRMRTAAEILSSLGKEQEFNLQQIALKRVTGDVQGEAMYTRAKQLTIKAIEKVKKDFDPELDKILGAGGGTGGKEKADDSFQKEYEKMRTQFETLIGVLNQTANLLNLSPMEQEFLKINDLLAKQIAEIEKLQKAGAITAKEAADTIRLAQQAATVSSGIAFDKDAKARAAKNSGATAVSFDDFLANQRANQTPDKQLTGNNNTASNALAAFRNDKLLGLQNNIALAATAKARMDAQIALLEEERARELENTRLTENQKLAINMEFNAKRQQIETEHQNSILDIIAGALQFASQAINILSMFDQARTNMENQALKRDIANNDRRKRDLEMTAKKGLITQNEVKIQTIKMDQEIDDKKRKLEAAQFERNKKIQIAQAITNGAMGIVSTLAARPGATDILSLGAFRAISIAMVVATTAAQIAAISSQKPQFAHGGILPGPSHREGGLPVINPRTGQAVAEVEGGELILSKKFVQSNPSLVPSLLHASKQGQRLMFLERQYQGINYAGLTRMKNKYADGGILNLSGSNPSPNAISPGTERMEQLLDALIVKLDQPFIGFISQQRIDQAASTRNKIISDAAFM